MENKQLVKLDHLLDRALADCPQMPLGLEAQILQHVSRAESKRPRPRVYALGTLVLAASLLGLFVRQKPVPPPSPKLYMASRKVEGEKMLPPGAPLLHEVAHRRKSKRTQQPIKASIFPSPTPMTSEERALVRFTQQLPEAAAAVFADLEKQREEPLHIEALNIVPLAEERSK